MKEYEPSRTATEIVWQRLDMKKKEILENRPFMEACLNMLEVYLLGYNYFLTEADWYE